METTYRSNLQTTLSAVCLMKWIFEEMALTSVSVGYQTYWLTIVRKSCTQIMCFFLLDNAPEDVPPTTTRSPSTLTRCQRQRNAKQASDFLGYRPQCTETGAFLPMQCYDVTNECWCVDSKGNQIGEQNRSPHRPTCHPDSGLKETDEYYTILCLPALYSSVQFEYYSNHIKIYTPNLYLYIQSLGPRAYLAMKESVGDSLNNLYVLSLNNHRANLLVFVSIIEFTSDTVASKLNQATKTAIPYDHDSRRYVKTFEIHVVGS